MCQAAAGRASASPADAEIEERNAERQDAVETAAPAADRVGERDVAPDGAAKNAQAPESQADLAESHVIAGSCAGQVEFRAEAGVLARADREAEVRHEDAGLRVGSEED